MDVCDLPQTVKAKISSYLYKHEILKCCHVSQKWYHSFNENYIFINSCEDDNPFNKEEFDKMMPNAKYIDDICTQFHHCQLLREYILQKIARKNVWKKLIEHYTDVSGYRKIVGNLEEKIKSEVDDNN